MDLGRGSVISLLSDMERDLNPGLQASLHGHPSFTRRMAVQKRLQGHAGCVNRLAYSDSADLLLSGSDDCTLRIWSVKSHTNVNPRGTVSPGHAANIFGVGFMPHTDNSYVISAGHDMQVRYTHVETSRSTLWKCHDNVVKTVSPLTQHTFVSASRDGTARLFDVRTPCTQEPPTVARIQGRMRHFYPLSSAIPSPTTLHHLLVAGSDAHMRVFDIRCSNLSANCLEKYSPPHLHPRAPEQGVHSGTRRATATYANFSPDGTQIVASYFDDAVVVFDRRRHDAVRAFAPPVMSRGARQTCVHKFTLDATRYLISQYFSSTIASANDALQLDGGNVFALVCKVEALLGRECAGDYRSAYATLQVLIDLVREDDRKIVGLWVLSEGEYARSADARTNWKIWRDKADIWLVVFQFLQTYSLYRMIPPLYFSMLLNAESSERILTMKRLKYLDKLCKQLEEYRECKHTGRSNEKRTWETYVRDRALGADRETDSLYKSYVAVHRSAILASLVDKFVVGIGRLRDRLQDSMSCLEPDGVGKDFAGACPNSLASRLARHPAVEASRGTGPTRVWVDPSELAEGGELVFEDVFDVEEDGGSGIDDDDDDDENDNRDDYVEEEEDDDVVVDDDENDDGDDDNGDGGAYRNANNRRHEGNTTSKGVEIELGGKLEAELWGPLEEQTNCRSFHGHRSRQTDIKEANFYGSKNQFILSGSDDGHVFMWSAATSELVARVEADEQIVNCVLPHPRQSIIMASGIDSTIKVLSPSAQVGFGASGIPQATRSVDF